MRRAGLVSALLWLTFAAVFAALFLRTGSLWMAAALALLVLLPPVSCLWNLLARKNLKAAVTLSGRPRKGQPLQAAVTVRGGLPAPAGRLFCEVRLDNELTGESSTLRLPARPDGGGWRADLSLESRRCGRLRLTVTRLFLTDFSGIFSVKCRQSADAKLLIYPETFPLDVAANQLAAFAEDGDTYQDYRRGNDPTEIFQLREYVPGDPVRSIHWKLSSKVDKLIFREPSQPMDRSLLIYWDHTDGSPEVLDALAESVFSLCQSLSEQGCPYTLGWPENGEVRLEEVTDGDSLLRSLPPLLRRRQGGGAQPDTAAFGRTLWFTASSDPAPMAGRVRYFCCGDVPAAGGGVTAFTPATCQDVLQRLDFGYEG